MKLTSKNIKKEEEIGQKGNEKQGCRDEKEWWENCLNAFHKQSFKIVKYFLEY